MIPCLCFPVVGSVRYANPPRRGITDGRTKYEPRSTNYDELRTTSGRERAEGEADPGGCVGGTRRRKRTFPRHASRVRRSPLHPHAPRTPQNKNPRGRSKPLPGTRATGGCEAFQFRSADPEVCPGSLPLPRRATSRFGRPWPGATAAASHLAAGSSHRSRRAAFEERPLRRRRQRPCWSRCLAVWIQGYAGRRAGSRVSWSAGRCSATTG
jgi:hypothetical protein